MAVSPCAAMPFSFLPGVILLLLRTCPNGKCKHIWPDEVGQCTNCGAPMSRTPDAPPDVNAHLYGMRANAGTPNYSGGQGKLRPGSEPVYADTRAVADVAREIVLQEMMGGENDG